MGGCGGGSLWRSLRPWPRRSSPRRESAPTPARRRPSPARPATTRTSAATASTARRVARSAPPRGAATGRTATPSTRPAPARITAASAAGSTTPESVRASGSGGDAGRTENLDPVLGRCGDQRRKVGRRLSGRRDGRRRGRLPHRTHEVLEAGGLGDEQETSLRRADDERVRDVARAVDERPGPSLDDLPTDPEGQRTFEDVEPLVLTMVDVEW